MAAERYGSSASGGNTQRFWPWPSQPINGGVRWKYWLWIGPSRLRLRCFLPIHIIYDTATSRPVAVLLRPGKTSSGREIRVHLRRLLRAIQEHWPHTHITFRGDSHYARPEVMSWCDENGIDFVFGLAGNDVLRRARARAERPASARRRHAHASRYERALASAHSLCEFASVPRAPICASPQSSA